MDRAEQRKIIAERQEGMIRARITHIIIAMMVLGYVPVSMAVTADIAPTAPQAAGQPVSFTAVKARGSGTLSYAWDFGDGTVQSSYSPNPSVPHTYAAPGIYDVVLQVRDDAQQIRRIASQIIYNPPTNPQPTSSGTIIYDTLNDQIWNANPDNDTVTCIDAKQLVKLFEVPVGNHPRTLAQAPDGSIWVANQDDATVSVLDSDNGMILATIPLRYASQPYGIVFSSDGTAGYVTLQGTGQLVKLDPKARSLVAILDVVSTPRGIAVSGDSKRILVTRFISPQDHGEVMEVDATNFRVVRTFHLALDPGPDTATSGRGVPNYLSSISISPDGTKAWIPSKKDNTVRGLVRDGQPLTFENTVRAIVSQIDLLNNREDLSARLDINNADLAVAVRFSVLGNIAFIAIQGGNGVAVVNGFNSRRLGAMSSYGLAPQGLVLDPPGRKLFLHNFMSRTVVVVDVSTLVSSTGITSQKLIEIPTVTDEKLSAQVLLGKQIFYNAADRRMSRDGYISCASCHLDGEGDGRVWDFTDRGEGLRNTHTLKGGRGVGNGRLHWAANFDEVQDFEHDIRGPFRGRGFMSDTDFHTGTRHTTLGDSKSGISPALDALAAYVASLDAVPRSPFRNADGTLTVDGRAGKAIFQRLACARCHAGPRFTDSALHTVLLHDIGTIKAASGHRLGGPLTGLDTPTLRGLWATAPYLHDGSAATLMDVITTENPDGLHGDTASLTDQEKQQLISYLLQIDELEQNVIPGKQAVTRSSVSKVSR